MMRRYHINRRMEIIDILDGYIWKYSDNGEPLTDEEGTIKKIESLISREVKNALQEKQPNDEEIPY